MAETDRTVPSGLSGYLHVTKSDGGTSPKKRSGARKRTSDYTPPTFCFMLPENTAIILDGDRKEIRCTTPAAAEIISAIVKDKGFQTKGRERGTILRLSRQIASRYSGHPIN